VKRTLKKIAILTLSLLLIGSAFLAISPSEVIYQVASMLGQPKQLKERTENEETEHWIDDYFTVEKIDEITYAISEARYWQYNNSYLLIGTDRAVLFDSGPGIRDLRPIIRNLTKLPVTTIPSHFHYDHVGFLGRFDAVALPDLPSLRARVDDEGWFELKPREHLGSAERIAPPEKFKVSEWLTIGQEIELGNRRLKTISTPGHTPESIVLHDKLRKQIFVGDFIYTGALFTILPGGSTSQYTASAGDLSSKVESDTTFFPGHGPWNNPKITYSDLNDLMNSLHQVKLGLASEEGLFPRKVAVNSKMELWLPFAWND
jgi:hydroxyacylglutathione hydrolase